MSCEESDLPKLMTRRDRKPTLLVVDDEPEMLRTISDLLRLEYRVLTFQHGADALKALALDDTIDVILSDQRMPEMTGVTLLSEAKRIRPEVTRLLFTGYADIKAVIDAINEGSVFRYIAKPWDPEEMQSVICQAVDQRKLITEKLELLKDVIEKNARLVEANRLKKAFLEVASHELNTPVAVVLGMTELWKLTQSQTATSAERSWVEKIHTAGKRLASTVDRMFKLMRCEQSLHALQRSEVDLKVMVNKVLGELSNHLEARKQTIELHLASNLGSADVDADKLEDILTNLISNAIKFTPDCGLIKILASPDGLDWVEFSVKDQGEGIRLEDRPYLFEPFFTGYDTMHHSSGDHQYNKRGIGLGLSLVKTFVELHGGQVTIDSKLGEGSTFGFSLPRQASIVTEKPRPLTAV